jgi:Zn/Cd-binding protein ZinT
MTEETEEDTVDAVESLSITEKKQDETNEMTTEELFKESDMEDRQMSEDTQDESSVTAIEDDIEMSSVSLEKTTISSSWKDSLNLRNLLGVLTAPFKRNKSN